MAGRGVTQEGRDGGSPHASLPGLRHRAGWDPELRGPGVLTVRRLLGQSAWQGARVVAGARGLDRPVRFLNVMTVPDIVRWTKADELLITTSYPLPRRPMELRTLVDQLAQHEVSALAVKLNDYLPGLPNTVVALADDVGLPLISIPPEAPLDEILSATFSLIVAPATASLAEAHAIHDALLKVELAGGGLGALVHELSVMLAGAAVAVVDVLGKVRATAGETMGLPEPWRLGWTHGHPQLGEHAVSAIAPVRAGNIHHGWIVVATGARELPASAPIAVEHGALVAALEMTRDLAVLTVERQFAYEALRELLTSPAGEPGEAAARASRFGWDLDRQVSVLVSDIRAGRPRRRDPPDEGAVAEPEPEPHPTTGTSEQLSPAWALDVWSSAVRACDARAAVAGSSIELLAVTGADPEHTAERLYEEIADRCGWRIVVGVSKPAASVAELPRAYAEARTAMRVASRLGSGGPVTSYARLGLYRLLNEVERGDLEAFADEVLGPVLRLPEPARDELIATLQVLLAQRLNIAEAARQLHYHYNTLRYRVTKLEHLLGNFADDPDAWVSLEVALQIVRFLKVVEPRTPSPRTPSSRTPSSPSR